VWRGDEGEGWEAVLLEVAIAVRQDVGSVFILEATPPPGRASCVTHTRSGSAE